MNKVKGSCTNLYFGSNSSLVSAVRIGTLYSINNVLDDLDNSSNKISDSISNSLTEIDSSVYASVNKILDQLQSHFESIKSSTLQEELKIPEDLLIKAAKIFAHLSINRSNLETKIQSIATMICDFIKHLVNAEYDNRKYLNELIDAHCKLYISYPTLFRDEFEQFLITELENAELCGKLKVDRTLKSLLNNHLNLLHVISHSSILFHKMLQILFHYSIATKLDSLFIHLSQNIVSTFHNVWNDPNYAYSDICSTSLYIEPLQSVTMLIHALSEDNIEELERLQHDEKIDNGSERLIGQIVKKLSTLLQNSSYTYITKMLLTICLPYRLIRILISFSEREKLDLHVLIGS